MKRVLQGIFMLVSSLLVLYVVQAWYVPIGMAVAAVLNLVEIRRWRVATEPSRAMLLVVAFWPPIFLSLYWIVRGEEEKKKDRTIAEVMES